MLNEILLKILENEEAQVTFPNLTIDMEKAVESKCYQMLVQIRDIVDDDSLEDPECFQKVEEIIRLFEELDALEGIRHDF